jgi:hypothetical protein
VTNTSQHPGRTREARREKGSRRAATLAARDGGGRLSEKNKVVDAAARPGASRRPTATRTNRCDTPDEDQTHIADAQRAHRHCATAGTPSSASTVIALADGHRRNGKRLHASSAHKAANAARTWWPGTRYSFRTTAATRPSPAGAAALGAQHQREHVGLENAEQGSRPQRRRADDRMRGEAVVSAGEAEQRFVAEALAGRKPAPRRSNRWRSQPPKPGRIPASMKPGAVHLAPSNPRGCLFVRA